MCLPEAELSSVYVYTIGMKYTLKNSASRDGVADEMRQVRAKEVIEDGTEVAGQGWEIHVGEVARDVCEKSGGGVGLLSRCHIPPVDRLQLVGGGMIPHVQDPLVSQM
eukprot:CAMPEP_0115736762 /NCGR_PEP_ID=MMETSP0272-20121206/87430_1 /TAXON_ID=71861 /ORGANISM="Scrippsiella trochoidea, Strain CCMP3099" /LENGTH=107 /DNA_ID=CAMNT_0003180965 /DNA_START=339 /DNA_END=662 /DNA_ORIENTATION=-